MFARRRSAVVRFGLWTVGWGVAPTEFDLDLDLVAVHLDFEFPFESVGDDERNGVTARVQFHFGSRRQGAAERDQSLGCLLAGKFGLLLDLQLRHGNS